MSNFIDISFAQGAVNWDAIEQAYKSGQIGGVIIRSGYGGGGVDQQFKTNQAQARTRGIPRQYYFYAYPGRSAGAQQAHEHFNIVGQLQVGESISVDMEDDAVYGRVLIASDVQWTVDWANTAKALFGPSPMVYMNSNVLGRFDWSPVKNLDIGLWLANYGANNGSPGTPPATKPWDFAALWQFTSQGNVAGIHPVDVSNGLTVEQFLKYGLQGSAPTPPPAPTPSPVPTPAPGGTYTVVKTIPGYVNASDAAAHKNSNSQVPAGIYSIFNQANGMINVTRVQGQPGWWINPSDNTSPTPSPAPGNTYTVNATLKGYVNANDAMTGNNSNSTVPAGTYAVFNRASNGAINVTRQAGVPGWWINPNTNPGGGTPPPSGGVNVSRPIPGYVTAADAASRKNSNSTVPVGTYSVYNTYQGMQNITRTAGQAGWWINPGDL